MAFFSSVVSISSSDTLSVSSPSPSNRLLIRFDTRSTAVSDVDSLMNFEGSVAYTYQQSRDVVSVTSSTQGSNYRY